MIPVEALLSMVTTGHTEFQMDHFITVRSGGTPFGCLFQSLRELHKRWRGLVASYCQRRRLTLKIEVLSERSIGDSLKARLAAIRLDEMRMALSETQRHIENDEREFLRFYGQSAALYCQLGFNREPPTRETLARLDAERLEHHVKCNAALDLLSTGRISRNTATLLQAMPVDSRENIARLLTGNANHLIEWYMTYSPAIPDPILIDGEQARKLLVCCESHG